MEVVNESINVKKLINFFEKNDSNLNNKVLLKRSPAIYTKNYNVKMERQLSSVTSEFYTSDDERTDDWKSDAIQTFGEVSNDDTDNLLEAYNYSILSYDVLNAYDNKKQPVIQKDKDSNQDTRLYNRRKLKDSLKIARHKSKSSEAIVTENSLNERHEHFNRSKSYTQPFNKENEKSKTLKRASQFYVNSLDLDENIRYSTGSTIWYASHLHLDGDDDDDDGKNSFRRGSLRRKSSSKRKIKTKSIASQTNLSLWVNNSEINAQKWMENTNDDNYEEVSEEEASDTKFYERAVSQYEEERTTEGTISDNDDLGKESKMFYLEEQSTNDELESDYEDRESQRSLENLQYLLEEQENLRQELECNDDKIQQIEKVLNGRKDETKKPEPCNEVQQVKKKTKYDYVIEELLTTEQTYAKTLEDILNDYVNYLEDNFSLYLTEDVRTLFVYIRKIFHGTIQFLEDINRYNGNWEAIAKRFIRHKELFELYPGYSLYKYKSDDFLRTKLCDILKERQLELKQCFDLPSQLLVPVQRLVKYKLMLNELQKLDRYSKPVTQAIQFIEKQLRSGNNYIAINSIECNPYVGECDTGSFVMRDEFIVKNWKKKYIIFLFEKIIIFTTPIGGSSLLYQGSLKLCDLSIGSFKKGTPCFDLIHFNRKNKKKDVIYTLQAENMEIKTRWTQWIRDKLFEQMEEERSKRRNSGSNIYVRKYIPTKRKPKKTKKTYALISQALVHTLI